MQAVERSCLAEKRRRTIEIEIKAQEEEEAAVSACRARAQDEHNAALEALQDASKRETDNKVNATRQTARFQLAQDLGKLQAKYDQERAVAVEQLQRALSADLSDKLQARRRALEEEADSQVKAVQDAADAEVAQALETLKQKHTEQTEAQLAAVRHEYDSKRPIAMAALEREMEQRRDKLLSDLENECQMDIKMQSESIHKVCAASRDHRVRALKSQLDREAEEHLEKKKLRAELEVARLINSLRAECLADMERCRQMVEGRNWEAGQKLMSLIRLKHTKEADALTTRGEREARHAHALIQELRHEWQLVRDMLELHAAGSLPAATSTQALMHDAGVSCASRDVYEVSIELDKALRQAEHAQNLLDKLALQASAKQLALSPPVLRADRCVAGFKAPLDRIAHAQPCSAKRMLTYPEVCEGRKVSAANQGLAAYEGARAPGGGRHAMGG